MNGLYIKILLFALCIQQGISAQVQRYTVRLAPFSTSTYHEFSPVFYLNGLTFCSNQGNKSLVGYRDGEGRLFDLYYVPRSDSVHWKQPRLLARELVSDFNDGPATFNESGNILYYSKNNNVEKPFKNISDTIGKLGIYAAELIKGTWQLTEPYPYNDHLYNFTMPAITPDGSRIFFSSDMPGGSGGMDLYCSNWQSNTWSKPVNLGPYVNSPGNETFPFACGSGRLYFASDGHQGYGGKDLYYTQEIEGEWIAPVHLDTLINSPADDFGIVLDSTLENGFFSSNRRKTDDIFAFSSTAVKFASCEESRENKFCFTFYDENYQAVDTIPVLYLWDFGDGIIYTGPEVGHCFPGPGDYLVRLNILDQATGDPVSEQIEYLVNLENMSQATLQSYPVGMVDQPVIFSGLQSNLKDLSVTGYWWDFGNGFTPGGPVMKRTYATKGEYNVHMGLAGTTQPPGISSRTCVAKTIRIYDHFSESIQNTGEQTDTTFYRNDSLVTTPWSIQIRTYIMDDLSEKESETIKEVLARIKGPAVLFDRFGLLPSSYSLLDAISAMLKENTDIRLEVTVHAWPGSGKDYTDEMADHWARQLAFYLRNKDLDPRSFRCTGFGLQHPFLNQVIPIGEGVDGVLEFIFIHQ